MSLSEDQEKALSQQMSEISIEPNGSPPTDGSDLLIRQREMLLRPMMFFETLRSITAPVLQFETIDRTFLHNEWRNEYHQRRMTNLLQFQGNVGMTEFNKPCLHCKVCRNSKKLTKEEADRNILYKWSRQKLMRRKLQMAKIEREREIWKRRNIEQTILTDLLAKTQNLIDGMEGFHHLRSRPSRQQPSPQSIMSDSSDTITLSETDSATSTIPSDLD